MNNVRPLSFFQGSLPTLLQGLVTPTPDIKKRVETDTKALMSSFGTLSSSSSSFSTPSWMIEADLVITRANREGFPLRLGAGGAGSVYLGFFLDMAVAKKVFHQDEDFDAREVELCFQLRHPNIIRLLGASAAVSDLPPCLYFELADGPSLKRVFSSAMPVPAELKMKISREIASGMTYLHSQNPIIIHRDLKPDNIMLTSGLQVKIIDFGLSVFVKASQSGKTNSKPGAGTEPYSSPEILLLNRTIDHKVDVWSFGMTLYELWSGIAPWRVPGRPGEMLFQSIPEALKEKERPFLDIGAIPAELKKMIAGCWNEDAKDRPEFVSLYRELCVSEFEEMSSHLKQLSLGNSSSSSSLQGLFFIFFALILNCELIVCLC